MPRFSPTLLDHAQNPRNAGDMRDASLVGNADLRGGAPKVQLFIKVEADKVVAASFLAFGCGVTIASMSMLTNLIVGRTLGGCCELCIEELVEALNGIPGDKRFCGDLAISALREAIGQKTE